MGSSHDSPPSAKRPRRADADGLVRRKRASIACQFCRLRKTRCDNLRPVCGVCRYHQATCIYPDEEDTDHPVEPLEALGQDIVSRLEEIKSILQASASAIPIPPDEQARPRPSHGEQLSNPTIPEPVHLTPSGESLGPSLRHVSVQLPCLNTRCETVLQWPVLNALVPKAISEVEYLLFGVGQEKFNSPLTNNHEAPLLNVNCALSTPAAGLQEEQFLPLCQKFLKYVHARNPILDPAQLLRTAAELAESGLRWDAPSCLVLTACALACYTESWPGNQASSPLNNPVNIGRPVPSAAQAQGRVYFIAARKRLGLLGTSVIDIQCFFLASMLEKCLLQPLKAWFHLQQACQRLQALLKKQDRQQVSSLEGASNAPHSWQHLEQRIFWSCYKSEQELVTEIGLQPSGLENLDYPYLLPDPPVSSMALPATSPKELSPEFSSTDTWLKYPGDQPRPAQPEAAGEEQSWSFYLTEISMRRTIVQTLRPLYDGLPSDWLAKPERVLQYIDDTLEQTRIWYQHLPPSVRFSSHSSIEPFGEDELTTYTRGRFVEWREACLRPALYLILHHNLRGTTLDLPTYLRLHSYAQRCLEVSAAIIHISSCHFRHGGTWFVLRTVFRSAMQIVAAVHFNHLIGSTSSQGGDGNQRFASLIAHTDLKVPDDWPGLCSMALDILGKWHREAADIHIMKDVLEAVMVAVQPHKS